MKPRTSTPATSDNGSSRIPDIFYGSGEEADVKDRYWLHVLLFVLTFATTAHVGGMLAGRVATHEELGMWWFLPDGIRFATGLLGFLTVHEFGHYFAARYHKISTSLPYYIPLPFVGIGTLGAVIRIREPVPTTRKLFDVGAAGPLAGFVAALGVLLYAFFTLPPPEYLLTLDGHGAIQEYIRQYGTFPDEMPPAPDDEAIVIVIGQTPLYWTLSQFFTDVPPMYEMIHYPWLLAGWFGLFFTALNLLPVGQLDGGHVLYSLVGRKWHNRLARGFVILLLASGSVGFIETMGPIVEEGNQWYEFGLWLALAAILFFFLNKIYRGDLTKMVPWLVGLILLAAVGQVIAPIAEHFGYSGWLFWCLLIVYLIRIEHPPVLQPEPLTPARKALAIANILIFIMCFSIRPIYVA